MAMDNNFVFILLDTTLGFVSIFEKIDRKSQLLQHYYRYVLRIHKPLEWGIKFLFMILIGVALYP